MQTRSTIDLSVVSTPGHGKTCATTVTPSTTTTSVGGGLQFMDKKKLRCGVL
jgi:hypothetical protein